MRRLALTLLAMLVAVPAWPQAYNTAPNAPQPPLAYVGPGFDPTNQAVNLNQLAQAINKILVPLMPLVPNGVNFIAITPGASGTGVTIGVQPGGDANAAIKIQPAGNGNIVLFDSVANLNSTGLIKIGNIASWVPIQGIASCPGVPAGRAPLGMSDHIRGYLMTKDWLDRTYGMPSC